jgi:Fe2+ transport system protein FeoA
MAETALDSLPFGRRAHISRLLLADGARRRMMELGFVPGASVSVLHKSPCGGIAAYGVHGAVIALRGRDARQILVE